MRFVTGAIGTGAVEFPTIARCLSALEYANETVLEILDDDPDRALSHSVSRMQKLGWPTGPSN
jgi:hypothetical protein